MAQGLAIAALAAAIGIGLILLQAGVSKLRHRILLPGVIANYRLLPPALVAPAATLLPLAEIAIGATLIAGLAPVPVLLAMLLLAIFASAMAINIARGRSQGEIDRYTVWPGQACSYTIGHTVWVQLRDEARRRAGARWDPRAFHGVLALGAMPLTVLQKVVRERMG